LKSDWDGGCLVGKRKIQENWRNFREGRKDEDEINWDYDKKRKNLNGGLGTSIK